MAESKGEILNVGVIGLGMGRAHVLGYSNYYRSRVSALCDSDTALLASVAQEFRIDQGRCFKDWRDMLSRADELDLDAVSVVLPNALHSTASIAALKQGLHVLCEKPMATSAREGRRMVEAASKANRKLMINFSFRFREQSMALKRLIDSGAVGEIYFGRTAWHRRRGLPGFGGWFGTKKLSGGGPIIDLGVHRLDLAMWLMGNPRPVTVSGSTYGHIGSRLAREQQATFDVEDLGCAMVRFDNGSTLLLEASWAGFSEKREDMITHLFGTRGGIVQRNLGEGYDFEAHAFSEAYGGLWDVKLQQGLSPLVTPYQEFADAVLDDREPLSPGQHGLDVQLILDAIYRSSATGKEIRIRNDRIESSKRGVKTSTAAPKSETEN
jgi:predicted dehydrogenase